MIKTIWMEMDVVVHALFKIHAVDNLLPVKISVVIKYWMLIKEKIAITGLVQLMMVVLMIVKQ
jgi:hypothetical protein